jgi:hypothetical protein
MKKIYSLPLIALLCCFSFASFAGPTTTNVFASGASGSRITGSSDGATITDGSIVTDGVSGTGTEGYAVFDLTSIPLTAVIEFCTVNFNISSLSGPGTVGGWNLYAYPGDLSGVGPAAVLYAAMGSGTLVSIASYGAGTGNTSLPSTAPLVAFLQANIGSKVSICWTGGNRKYTITGETGFISTAGAHAPYLGIQYCGQPSITSTSASPNPVCENTILTLNGVVSMPAGLSSYIWTGPGIATTTSGLPATLTATSTSAGVYTLTAVNVCATTNYSVTATTTAVSVNPAPSAIIGASVICKPGSTQLSDATPGGTWTAAPGTIATVSSTGLVSSGTTSGVTTISYTFTSTGCYATIPMSVNPAPVGLISGPTLMCEGDPPVVLTIGSTAGTWSSSTTTVATIDPLGNVTGVGGGSTTITYLVPGCSAVTGPFFVDPLPAPITGSSTMCTSSTGFPPAFINTDTLTDATSGGKWSISPPLLASIGSAGTGNIGVVQAGMTTGSSTITYKISATGCLRTFTVDIAAAPPQPTGSPLRVCPGQTISLSDAGTGGTWQSSNVSVATVVAVGTPPDTVVVTGVVSGTARISYTTGPGCAASKTITVIAGPSPITAPATMCSDDSVFLSDASPGGVWSTTNTAIASLGSSNGFFKALAGGSSDITYTFPATGCYASTAININNSPLANITGGPTTFCTGGSVTLSVVSVIGNTYQWYDGGVAIPPPVGTVPVYTTSVSQTLTVKVVNTILGCTTYSKPVVVISGLFPTLDASGPLSFCQGRNVTLSANAHGAGGVITYQWQKNGANIPSANTASLGVNQSGIYDCIVSVSGSSGSCTVPTTLDTVTTTPLPVPSITYGGGKLYTGNGYLNYQWFLNGIGVLGAVSSVFTPAENGKYRVTVTDKSGCTGMSTEIVIASLGINEVNKTDINIFPNPARSVVHIESPVAVKALITGLEGKTVLETANATDINISSLPNGLYLIMLYDEHGQRLKVEKLVKE